jgi:hypothetical protein
MPAGFTTTAKCPSSYSTSNGFNAAGTWPSMRHAVSIL